MRKTMVIAIIIVSMTAFSGFVSIAPGGKHFEHNNEPLVLLGFNDGLPWPSLAPLASGNISAGERYFKELSDRGVNVLRIMFEYSQGRHNLFAFENPLWEVNPVVVQIWDDIVMLAEKYGIYLIITPWDPFWAYENWDVNPYNIANGGTIESMRDFLTDPDTVENAIQRFKFMIDRYGESEKILAWELNNEIELWYGRIFHKPDPVNAREINEWIETISTFIRNYEIEKFGEARLITVSTAAPAVTGALARVLYDFTHIDFVTTHFYYDTIKTYSDPYRIARDVVMNINYHNYLFEDSVPFFDSESGPIDRWPQLPANDIACYSAFSWAHLASGGTGIGMRWPYTTPHRMPTYLLDIIEAISRFVKSPGIDWLDFTGVNLDALTSYRSEKPIFLTNSADRSADFTQIIGYAIAESGDIGEIEILFKELPEATFVFEAWDTRSGEVFCTTESEPSDNLVSVSLYVDALEFAFKLYEKE